jgi:hypothetical protein
MLPTQMRITVVQMEPARGDAAVKGVFIFFLFFFLFLIGWCFNGMLA